MKRKTAPFEANHFLEAYDMKKPIYLDNAATTATRPEVVQAMLPYFGEFYGNPSTIYSLGTSSKQAEEQARKIIGVPWSSGAGYLFHGRRQ